MKTKKNKQLQGQSLDSEEVDKSEEDPKVAEKDASAKGVPSKYPDIPGLEVAPDGHLTFKGQRVKSITGLDSSDSGTIYKDDDNDETETKVSEVNQITPISNIEEVKKMTALENLGEIKSMQPIESIQEVSKITPVSSIQEVTSMKEVKSIKPVPDQLAINFIRKHGLVSKMNNNNENADNKLEAVEGVSAPGLSISDKLEKAKRIVHLCKEGIKGLGKTLDDERGMNRNLKEMIESEDNSECPYEDIHEQHVVAEKNLHAAIKALTTIHINVLKCQKKGVTSPSDLEALVDDDDANRDNLKGKKSEGKIKSIFKSNIKSQEEIKSMNEVISMKPVKSISPVTSIKEISDIKEVDKMYRLTEEQAKALKAMMGNKKKHKIHTKTI